MNREIKFRAWADGSWLYREPRMFYSKKFDDLCEETALVGTELIWHYDDYYEGSMYSSQSDKILNLMQYTGLKDKNGVEIYEGDIIKSDRYTKEVCYHNERGMFVGHDKQNYNIPLYEELYHYEVIGNIHEHKHLLKS